MTQTPNNPTPAPTPAAREATSDFAYSYLSEMIGTRIRYEGEAKPFGRLYDLGARRIHAFPQTVCIDVKTRDGHKVIPWAAVRELSLGGIIVSRETGEVPVDFWVRRDVLDDEVVDVTGARVRRVNDVHLIQAEGQLIIGHVEVGILGILRRLGIEKFACWLTRWLLDLEIKESFLGWKRIEVLSPGPVPGGLRITGAPERFADMMPGELADVVEQLGRKEQQTLFNSLSVETAADTLEQVEPDVQRTLIAQQEPGKAADILEEMRPSEAADVLRDMPRSDADKIINRMETDGAEEVRSLLQHKERSAGGVLEPSCVTASPTDVAGTVLERIHKGAEQIVELNHIYVLDSAQRLVGVLTLHELMSAPADESLQALMTMPVISVEDDTSLRDVARLFVKYGFRSLPVVDKSKVFLGVVRLRQVLDEIASLPQG